MDQSAAEIYQDTLDQTSKALMARDFATMRERIQLPHLRRTLVSQIVIETEEDFFGGIDELQKSLRELGVDSLIRLVISASRRGDDFIEGIHVTHTLRGATPVIPSYLARSVLRRTGGVWKVTEIEPRILNRAWPVDTPRAPSEPDMPEVVGTPSHTEPPGGSQSPEAIYQSFLDTWTAMTEADDFDDYSGLFTYPCTFHFDGLDKKRTRPEGLRPFFRMMRKILTDNPAAKLSRKTTSAVFLNSHLICGYHVASIDAGETCIQGPVLGRILLRHTGKDWRVRSITNNLQDMDYDGGKPVITRALRTLLEIEERNRGWSLSF